ncbi:MAG: preprotein translocase subunit YajC [Verrucomicrobiota bacterium]|nr:preprotein translocase subunit YajC [Verrucomicrobiota bacterium]
MPVFDAMLAFAPTAQPGTQPDPRAQLLQMFGTLAFFALMMYFVAIRPQQRKAKEQAALLKGLKTSDKILTTSGIVGTVVTVKDKSVVIRSADTKLEVLKSAVSEITEKSSSEA